MQNIDQIHVAHYLRTTDLGFVQQFYNAAIAKLKSLEAAVPKLVGFQFTPIPSLTGTAAGKGDGNALGIMNWVASVEAPVVATATTKGDDTRTRNLKFQQIDILGRLAATAAMRVVDPPTAAAVSFAAVMQTAETAVEAVASAVSAVTGAAAAAPTTPAPTTATAAVAAAPVVAPVVTPVATSAPAATPVAPAPVAASIAPTTPPVAAPVSPPVVSPPAAAVAAPVAPALVAAPVVAAPAAAPAPAPAVAAAPVVAPVAPAPAAH